MKIIISQPYIKVLRSIENNKQLSIEKEEYLHLCEDKIITDSNVFYLKNVHDISYKILSNSTGFLYLHTNQGVFSFNVFTKAHDFIDTYRNLKERA